MKPNALTRNFYSSRFFFLNQTKKQENILFVTGHVKEGIASRFKGNIDIIDRIDNWQGTGKIFEYYRRNLD